MAELENNAPTPKELARSAAESLDVLGTLEKNLPDEARLALIATAIQDVQGMVNHPDVDTQTRTNETLKEHTRQFAQVVRERIKELRTSKKDIFGRFSLYSGTVPGASVVAAGGAMRDKIRTGMSFEELLEIAMAVHYVGYVDAQGERKNITGATRNTVFATKLTGERKQAQDAYVDGMLTSLVELGNEFGWHTSGIKSAVTTLPRMSLELVRSVLSDDGIQKTLAKHGIEKEVAWIREVFPPSARLEILLHNPKTPQEKILIIARMRTLLEDDKWLETQRDRCIKKHTSPSDKTQRCIEMWNTFISSHLNRLSVQHTTEESLVRRLDNVYAFTKEWHTDDERSKKLEEHGLKLKDGVTMEDIPASFLSHPLQSNDFFLTLSKQTRGLVQGTGRRLDQEKLVRRYFTITGDDPFLSKAGNEETDA